MKPFDLQKITRKNIRDLVPYSSARSEYGGNAQVFLDANENNLAAAWSDYTRYPDPLQNRLKERVAALKEVDKRHIFLGNGSDEPIDLLMRAFCVPGKDNIITLLPTYGMYKVAADINDVTVIEVPMNEDFQPDVEQALASVTEASKILFICSPNNPTGNLISPNIIEALLTGFEGIVVLDEAYIDFAGGSVSWIPKLKYYPNLVILQTFSKAWGMAALRLGIAFASAEIVGILNKIKSPYNISLATQELALSALTHINDVTAAVAVIKEQRQLVAARLETLPFVEKVFPSDANFLLVRVTNANSLYQYLLDRNIVIRNRTNTPLCANCIRITIGTPTENEILLTALNDYADNQ